MQCQHCCTLVRPVVCTWAAGILFFPSNFSRWNILFYFILFIYNKHELTWHSGHLCTPTRATMTHKRLQHACWEVTGPVLLSLLSYFFWWILFQLSLNKRLLIPYFCFLQLPGMKATKIYFSSLLPPSPWWPPENRSGFKSWGVKFFSQMESRAQPSVWKFDAVVKLNQDCPDPVLLLLIRSRY